MYSKKIKSLLEELFTCPICLDILKDPATTKCGHSFCIECVKKNKFECAVCRSKIEANFNINYVVKKAIDSLQNMNEEEFENKYSCKERNSFEYSATRKKNDEKLNQTELKPKRSSYSRENNLPKSENVNIYRMKRLRSQIDCFNEIDKNYIKENGKFLPNYSHNSNSGSIQGQNLECNRNLFNNVDYNDDDHNKKFLFPDSQNSNINKLTSKAIDNFLDNVLINFQNGRVRNSSFNNPRNYSINFFNNENIQTPIHTHVNNFNINIYNVPSPNQINSVPIENSNNLSLQNDNLSFNTYEVPFKRFKYK